MKINKIVENFMNNIKTGIILFDNRMNIEFANEYVLDMLKISLSDIQGKRIKDFVKKYFDTKEENAFEANCKNKESVAIIKKGNSTYIIRCFPVSGLPAEQFYLMAITDVSSVKEYKESVSNAIELSLAKSILEFIPDILFAVNTEGEVIVWNSTAEELTGIKKEEILGKGNYEYAIAFYGKRRPMLVDFALRGEKPDKFLGYESVEFEKDTITAVTESAALRGRKRILWGKARRFYDSDGNVMGAIEVVRDITKIKKMEKRLRYLATRDPLTKLYNRREFEVLLLQEIEHAKRTGDPITIVYIDVDNLKKINDEFGHKKGDELLVKVANILKKNLRKYDIAARVGGDEFIVVLPGMHKEDAESLIRRIKEKAEKESERLPYNIDFSFGAAELHSGELHSAGKAVVEADRAMYQMKKKKKSQGNCE